MTKKKPVIEEEPEEEPKPIMYRYDPDRTLIANVGDGRGGFVEKESHWIPTEGED